MSLVRFVVFGTDGHPYDVLESKRKARELSASLHNGNPGKYLTIPTCEAEAWRANVSERNRKHRRGL